MKHLKYFKESWNTDKWLDPEEVKPDMIGVYNNAETGERYIVQIIEIMKLDDMTPDDYQKFRKENAGWMPPDIRDLYKTEHRLDTTEDVHYPEVLEEYLVMHTPYPLREVQLNEVDFYDQHHGIVVPIEQRWRGSSHLSQVNNKSGVFENAIDFQLMTELASIYEFFYKKTIPAKTSFQDSKDYPLDLAKIWEVFVGNEAKSFKEAINSLQIIEVNKLDRDTAGIDRAIDNVVILKCKNEWFIVSSEGYDYWRYIINVKNVEAVIDNINVKLSRILNRTNQKTGVFDI